MVEGQVKHPKIDWTNKEQRDYEMQMLECAMDLLTVDELFDLCKQISEASLPQNHELYQYFHDDGNRTTTEQTE